MAANADLRASTVRDGPAAIEDGAVRCVDVLVAQAGGLADRPLTYLVPPALRALAAVGMRAVVPLGARRALGFVLSVRPSAAADEAAADAADRPPPPKDGAPRMRAVLDFPDDAPLFSETLLSLAREIADETLSSLREAVECLVPPEVFHAPIPARPRIAVRDPAGPLPPRPGRRQAAMLAMLSASPSGVPVSELLRGGGGPVLRRLAAAGVVRIQELPRSAPAHGRQTEGAAGRPPEPGRGRAALHPAPEQPLLLLGDAESRARRIAMAVAATIRGGDRAVVVVPEIGDVAGVAERLAREERAASVVLLHSALSPRERRAAWLRARDGRANVVVGTRSALFTPLPRLGLIVLDDEQSVAYKSDAAPRYHARDVAFRRARLDGARLLLGSPAPSVELYAAAASGEVAEVRLPAPRPAPVIGVVDMRAEERRGHVGYLSRALVQAMSRHLRARGRIALLVSRRGYARVLLCRECGAAVRCPACDVAMAYDRDGARVWCRVCGRTGPAPDLCPRCGGVGLRGVGAGTKRIEEVVQRLFPALRMARLDADTAHGAAQVLKAFADGRVRLLVGTAIVLRTLAARARPTLVGVVDADGPLYLPDFRAAERTLQRLRAAVQLPAALGQSPPEAIIQTRVPEHPVMRAIRTRNDAIFYGSELTARRDLGYPPYARLVRLVAEGSTMEVAHMLAERLTAAARAQRLDVLGPAPLHGARGRRRPARVQCVLRVPQAAPGVVGAVPSDDAAARRAIRAVIADVPPPPGARVVVDVDPQEMV